MDEEVMVGRDKTGKGDCLFGSFSFISSDIQSIYPCGLGRLKQVDQP